MFLRSFVSTFRTFKAKVEMHQRRVWHRKHSHVGPLEVQWVSRFASKKLISCRSTYNTDNTLWSLRCVRFRKHRRVCRSRKTELVVQWRHSFKCSCWFDQSHAFESVCQQNHLSWLVITFFSWFSNSAKAFYRFLNLSEGLQTLENLIYLNVAGNLIGRYNEFL